MSLPVPLVEAAARSAAAVPGTAPEQTAGDEEPEGDDERDEEEPKAPSDLHRGPFYTATVSETSASGRTTALYLNFFSDAGVIHGLVCLLR